MFKSCIEIGIFADEWKKANFVLIHKKGDNKKLPACFVTSDLWNDF